MDVRLNLTGDRLAVYRLDRLSQKLHERYNQAVHELTGRLLDMVKAAEPVRTGRLQSQTRARFRDSPNRISGSIRPATRRADAAKAAALEYGAHRRISVAAHQMTLSHAWGEAIEPTRVSVEAYQRTVNIAERRFLRDPLAEMQGEITETFNRIRDELVAEANG